MRLDAVILGLRKLGHYLLALCPPLGRAHDRMQAAFARLSAAPRDLLRRKFPALARRAATARDTLRHFWWTDYSANRVDWSQIPPDAAPVLRAVLAGALLLCLLLPLALAFPSPALPPGALVKAGGPVAVWSVWAWLAALALAWGCLLAGAARCSRSALTACAILYLYYMGIASAALPRATANVLVPLGALMALFAAGKMRGGGTRAGGIASAVFVGALSGLALVALTPLKGVVPGRYPLCGTIPGILLGLSIFRLASDGSLLRRRHANTPVRPHGSSRPLPIHLAAWIIGGMTLVFLGSLAARGGAAVPGNAVIDFLTVWTGYLWPAYYFIGIGIVLKVLKSTKVLSRAAEELLPAGVFVPACAAFFAGGALLLWAPSVFDAGALSWPRPVTAAAAALYRLGAPRIWNDPLRATAALWLRWVFLFDLGAAGWCAATRRLSTRTVSALLFGTLLAWVFVVEYLVQFHGFAHAGNRSASAAFLFSIWLLWLLYSNGVKLSVRASASWPAAGRIALFGAAMLFLLLSVHARATIRDPLAQDEVFFALFLGLIDVGLPYALFVYADRRAARMPVPLSFLFGAFLFGAALTMPLAALDKLVDAGGSLSALREALGARFEAVLSGSPAPAARLRLPPGWIAARGALTLGALAAFAGAAARRRPAPERRAALALALLAASVGLAAFSKSAVFTELPMVSPRWALLFAPLVRSLYLDANVFAQYLAFALPALVLGLALTAPGGARTLRAAGGIAAAGALHLAVALAWPWHEAWLCSTGLLGTAGLAGLGLSLLLLHLTRARVEEAVAPGESGAGGAPPAVGPRAARALVCAAGAALGSLALFQAVSGRLVFREIPGLERPLPLPAAWDAAVPQPTSGGIVFVRRGIAPVHPVLLAAVASGGGEGGAAALLDRAKDCMARDLRLFSAVREESWDRILPGARALDFSFERKLAGGAIAPFMGTTALLPRRRGGALLLTLLDAPESWQTRRWDLVRAAEEMGVRGE